MILKVTFYDNAYTNLITSFFEQKQMTIPTFYISSEEKQENTRAYFRKVFNEFFMTEFDLIDKDKEFTKLCNDILYNNLYYDETKYNRLKQLFKEKFFLFIYRNTELLEDFSNMPTLDKIQELLQLIEIDIVPAMFSCQERDEIVYYFYSNDKFIKQ